MQVLTVGHKYAMKKTLILLAVVAVVGCSTTMKVLEVDTPKGYQCKVHEFNPKSYKVGEKYYCITCVDQNLGKVELVWNSIPTTAPTNSPSQ